MTDPSFLFWLYVFAVFAGAFFTGAFLVAVRVRRKGDVSRSFQMKLFRVALPKAQTKEPLTVQEMRDRIAVMEQLYTHLEETVPKRWFRASPPVFALELTVPHIGEEIIFYIAVPKLLSHSIEKIVEGVFPKSEVVPVKDYNIFNPEGAAVGAVVRLADKDFLPIRTYRSLESDPLSQLSNAFSKLAREGEGAAFQMVLQPARAREAARVRERAKGIFRKGEFSKKGVFRELMGELFKSGKPKKSSEQPERPKTLTPREEEVTKAIEGKGGRQLFHANLRIVASGPTETRAREILKDLETAFLQFDSPGINKFVFEERSGKSLKDLFYRFSFRMFHGPNSILLNSEELASLYHLPNIPLETPKIKVVKAKEAPAPTDLPVSGMVLGFNVFRGIDAPVRITPEDRRRHLYIIGQTGTGKSALMENMVRQDIQAGEGVCFIDPHGDTVEKVLGYVPENRMEDVIYFNPGDTGYPLGLNMLEYDPAYPEQKTFVVNELFSIFQKLYGAIPESMGPMFEQYFRNSTMLVLEDPASGNTLLEVERVFVDKEFRALKLSRSRNIVVNTFWREIAEKAGGEASLQNMTPYITSKFDTFLANEIMRPIIAQEHSAFNFREIMDQKKILLINLSKGRLGELNSSLIGLIMVGKLLMASLSRTDIPESDRKDFYVYIDEFQNVTTKSIATILSEARKYRLDLTITHQFIGQLEEEIKKAVFGNVGSQIAFRIGSDDAEFMTKQFAPVFGEEDLLNVDNYRAFIKLLVRGQTSTAFTLRTYPPEQSNRERAEVIKRVSRLKYGRPRDEVEAEIRSRYEAASLSV